MKRSPLYWFDQLNEPMLVIHGSDDKKVNIEHSKRLMDSLEKSPNKITPFFVEGGNHSLSNYTQIRNDTIANWFHYYLKSNKN
ncbi:alpha/beta hydrolase family protein [Formosa sp. Hel1_33_131]|uniref:alpha/beta hydrolase family protein n=1 Tax=Formosa sp. Hel1_33_131 TaxID=1336794 RepID=UPI0030012FED